MQLSETMTIMFETFSLCAHMFGPTNHKKTQKKGKVRCKFKLAMEETPAGNLFVKGLQRYDVLQSNIN